MSVRAAMALTNMRWRTPPVIIETPEQFRQWVKDGGDIRRVRNVGINTQRELEAWAGLPVTPHPQDRPRCKHCGALLREKGANK